MSSDTLLSDIERFVEAVDMSPITFGRKAVGDPHFVRDLRGDGDRKPRRVWPETEARVRDFMAEYRPDTSPEPAEQTPPFPNPPHGTVQRNPANPAANPKMQQMTHSGAGASSVTPSGSSTRSPKRSVPCGTDGERTAA